MTVIDAELKAYLRRRQERANELAERADLTWEFIRAAHAAHTAKYKSEAILMGEREYQRRMKALRRERAAGDA